jgi:hypothetical protein
MIFDFSALTTRRHWSILANATICTDLADYEDIAGQLPD